MRVALAARVSTTLRRLSVATGGLLGIVTLGTLGYVLFAGASWFDALYMTVITMSTVGYQEVFPLGRGGRLFTIGLILSTVGLALYFLTVLAESLVEGRLREILRGSSMQRTIQQLRDHVMVEDLSRHREPLVIVELDPAKTQELEACGHPHILGSALVDAVLDGAGISRARAIVIAPGSDADNVFIALSAREKNPRVRIHARGESEAAARRLALAGADQVVSPYQIGGRQVAAAILRPAVVDFLEIARPRGGDEVDLEEVRIDADSALSGRTIAAAERSAPRVRVVALKRGEDPIRLVPAEDTEIQAGDHLVVIGPAESLAALAQRASPAS
jgi:voltage-gated potassium channel